MGAPVHRYEVGYEGEMIGIYPGATPDEAIAACRADMHNIATGHRFKPSTPPSERLKGMIANQID